MSTICDAMDFTRVELWPTFEFRARRDILELGPCRASDTDFTSDALWELYYALGTVKAVKIPNGAGIFMRSIHLFILLKIGMRLDDSHACSETLCPSCLHHSLDEGQLFVTSLASTHYGIHHQPQYQPCYQAELYG